MVKHNNSFYNKLSQANIMSDGIQNEVTYGDIALLKVLKDKPKEIKKILNNPPTNEFL